MIYKIRIEKRALKFIEKQSKDKRELILKAIAKLPAGDIKSLKGHSDIFRLRVNDFRIIYTINNNELIICVIDAGNRGQIYQKY